MPHTIRGNTPTSGGQLALAYFLTSELLYIPTVIIIILLLTTFALLLYVIFLKITFRLRQKSKKRQFEIWQNLILEYLSGEVSSKKIAKEVGIKDFSLFSEFMEKYLETLKGEDFQNLTHLLKEMGLFDYNLKRLGSRKRWHRVYAAFFLGLLRDKEAVPALQKGLKDKDYLMSFASASGLAKSGQKEHLEETLFLGGGYCAGHSSFYGLISLGRAFLPALPQDSSPGYSFFLCCFRELWLPPA